jgi:DNA-binding response OmpR family regulator
MSKRVLVVEDEADIRRLVSIKLKGAGYDVSTANDGEEGLAAAVRDKPDLLVSDVMMPKKDGYTMVREVREALGSEAPAIIMLTARGQDTDVATGLDSGADDYIVKPFAPRELVARIQVVMLRHERQRGETRAP